MNLLYSFQIENRSNLPRNVPDIDHSQSKISVIQSHNEESLIQVQPPTAKINQKSLADELFEMEADHSILLRYGIRNSFTFENKTVEESLRDLVQIFLKFYTSLIYNCMYL